MFARFMERSRLAIREARAVRVSLLLATGLNLLAWVMAVWFVVPRLGNSFLALHYNIYFGTDRIGAPWRLVRGPAIGTLILFLNAGLAVGFYVRDRLASAFLMLLAMFLQMLVVASTFLVILLNS